MSLPIYQRVAVTDAGDVIPGAEYTVINENTGVAQPIYSDRNGTSLKSAPYFADSVGTIQFFIAQGTTFRVAASGGVGTYTDRYVYGVSAAVLALADGSATINRVGSVGSVLSVQKDGTTVGSIGSSGGIDLTIGNGDTGILFVDAADVIIPWNITTNAKTDGAITFGNGSNRFKDLYLSGGVYLGGTGAANKLDDYEEGTWTGGIGASSGTSGTWVLSTGTYIKIGSVVYIRIGVTGSDVGFIALGGYRLITGLPFAPSNECAVTWTSGSVNTGQAGSGLVTSAGVWFMAPNNTNTSGSMYLSGTYTTNQ